MINTKDIDYSNYTYEDFKYIEHNKILFKGVTIKVSFEFIQDADAGSIDWNEIVSHIITLYNKQISVIREYKINQILGE